MWIADGPLSRALRSRNPLPEQRPPIVLLGRPKSGLGRLVISLRGMFDLNIAEIAPQYSFKVLMRMFDATLHAVASSGLVVRETGVKEDMLSIVRLQEGPTDGDVTLHLASRLRKIWRSEIVQTAVRRAARRRGENLDKVGAEWRPFILGPGLGQLYRNLEKKGQEFSPTAKNLCWADVLGESRVEAFSGRIGGERHRFLCSTIDHEHTQSDPFPAPMRASKVILIIAPEGQGKTAAIKENLRHGLTRARAWGAISLGIIINADGGSDLEEIKRVVKDFSTRQQVYKISIVVGPCSVRGMAREMMHELLVPNSPQSERCSTPFSSGRLPLCHLLALVASVTMAIIGILIARETKDYTVAMRQFY